MRIGVTLAFGTPSRGWRLLVHRPSAASLAIGAVAGMRELDALTFIGTTAFSGIAGQLRYAFSGGNTYLQADTDGDTIADGFIRLDGEISLVAADLILI